MHGVIGGHDLVRVGQRPLLHDRGEGDGDVGEGHPLRAGLEYADVVFDDTGDDFAADTEAVIVLVDHDQPAGFAYRGDHMFAVQRHQAAQVDDLGADAVLLQLRGGAQGVVHAGAEADQADVAALAHAPGLPISTM